MATAQEATERIYRLYRRVAQIAAGGAALLFVIIGIAQRELILGILWGAVAALVMWILAAIVRRILLGARSRKARYAVPAEEEPEGAPRRPDAER